MPKRVTNVSKQLIELGGNCVNQLSAGPFRDVGNTRQRIASSEVYNPACVVNMSTCSSRSVVSQYWLIVNPFQRAGSSNSMILSTKGWRLLFWVSRLFGWWWSVPWIHLVLCRPLLLHYCEILPFVGNFAQFSFASAGFPLSGHLSLLHYCVSIPPTSGSSLVVSPLLLYFDRLLLLSTPSFLRIVWPHGGCQLYMIDTILVRNQTISRTLCVEPLPFPS